MKNILAAALAAAMTLSLLTACNSKSTAPGGASISNGDSSSDASIHVPADDDDENYDTGDASLDDPRNSDGIGESELLVVSFGTSYNDNRRLTIGAIESAIEGAFPDWSIRRGFTSQIIIDHVLRRDGEVIDNVLSAPVRGC